MTNVQVCTESDEHLRVCHVNCQSLFAHIDQFRDFFSNHFFHVICLSETWLKPGITDAMVHLSSYILIRCDRLGKNGGGVGVYVHISLSGKLLYASDGLYQKRPEFMLVEIACSNVYKVLIAVVYRPPKAGFFRDFEDKCLELYTGYRNLVIMGDFNSNLYCDSFDAKLLQEFVFSNGLFLVPFNATHHTSTSSTLLDLCILDSEQKLVDYGQCPVPFLSMHDLIFVRLSLRTATVPRGKLRRRDFGKLKNEVFLEDLNGQDWERFITTVCENEKIELLNKNLTSVLDVHAPMREWVSKKRPAPWLTNRIVQSMRERDRARRAWRKHRKPELYIVFKSLRNEVQSRIRRVKRNYYRGVLERKQKATVMWAELRRLGLIGSAATSDLHGFDLNDMNLAFSALHGEFNFVGGDEVILDSGQFDDSEFFFLNVSPCQILSIVHGGGSEAMGVDEISIGCLRLGLPSLLPYLTHLFNFLLQNSLYPELWKRALVRPIPKVKSPVSPSDFRPISLLCSGSKVMERIVFEQVVDYLETNHLLDDFQSAYRRGFSTQTALLRVLDSMREAVDKRMVTLVVLFDFSKAFDRVCHGRLLDKLRRLKFSKPVIQWFRAYLEGRKQAVRDGNGNTSSWCQLSCGVPQGSVLGPLLFSLYLSDFREIIDCCEYSYYADDLLIYLSGPPDRINEYIIQMNKEIEAIRSWATLNGLKLNDSKTRAMIVGSARHLNYIREIRDRNVMVGNSTVPFSESVKYLGVSITETLDWNEHVTHCVRKVNMTLYRLKVCKRFLPTSVRSTLVTSLINPLIDYACLAYSGLTGEQNLKIQRAYNSCVRMVLDVRKMEHITPYYAKLKWLKVDKRREYFLGMFMYRLFELNRPKYLLDKFTYRQQLGVRTTRVSNQLLALPYCRTETYKKSFTYTAADYWNRLPVSLRDLPSSLFRGALYDYLLKGS